MENFIFYSPTEFVFGRGTQARTGELCRQWGAGKVLLVSGGGSAERSGLLAQIRRSLTEAGLPYVEQKGIQPNPIDTDVYAGIEIARREGVDFILAVGGGSVIDSAKGTALGAVYDGDFWDFYCGKAAPERALPVGVVLTIPAAGSEGSGNSVITKVEGRHKISVRYPLILRPKFAVMNPELTLTLPWHQTAAGIADMLCHIYERYFSNTEHTDVPDALAEALMRDIMRQALILRREPDNYDARASVMWASTLAHNGLCGTGKAEDWASHRLEHELSAWHGVTHGAGLAVIFPAWLTFVATLNPGRVLLFAERVMGINPDGKTPDEVCRLAVEAVRGFYRAIGLPTTLRELIGEDFGTDEQIRTLVESLRSNVGDRVGGYVPLTMEQAEAVYRLAL